MDTIFALASAPGKAGVAIVRLSGPEAHSVATSLAGGPLPPAGRKLAVLRDAEGLRLDQALVLTFSAPASFTGEDVAELHLHGSPAVVAAVLRTLGAVKELRMAEPGEFTRRALENGRLDLAQVEGLADLIDAETEAQRRQALKVLSGDLGRVADGWRQKLIRAAALIEATIDFADEDVPEDVTGEVTGLITAVLAELDRMAGGVSAAERVRSGFEVAIVGAPNVGKSTLLNALAGRKAALTSEIAGTTRDVIEVRMDIQGLAVTVLDTAGLRDAEDTVERMGIELARERADQADLRVFLAEPGEVLPVTVQPGDIVLRPKGDLLGMEEDTVSGKTGQGVDVLISRIGNVLSERSASAGLATRERHRAAMSRAQTALGRALTLLSDGPEQYDIVADDIRHAVRALESLVGRIDVEDLLDEIFASFCLGK
ncbi:tRNA uridine-5-carboxymethylaminomethyl(34) synthesis GTPase MnmE [Seohaeicola nanhaiensis]|uniref:tRNA modification GTPase MnmE n=1 Tax=Seohaeicola nanhaiensis TaxID=1387282 RepID=A0ABV9KGP3_9RHOB